MSVAVRDVDGLADVVSDGVSENVIDGVAESVTVGVGGAVNERVSDGETVGDGLYESDSDVDGVGPVEVLLRVPV